MKISLFLKNIGYYHSLAANAMFLLVNYMKVHYDICLKYGNNIKIGKYEII